jgi:hypothetical protein
MVKVKSIVISLSLAQTPDATPPRNENERSSRKERKRVLLNDDEILNQNAMPWEWGK